MSDKAAWRTTGDKGDGVGDQGKVTDIGEAKKRGRGRPRRGDAWDLSSGGYDPDRFYTATIQGENGESEKVGIRVDVNMWARMQGLIHSGKIPAYKNAHDFMRDALVHRIMYLEQGINDPLMAEWANLLVRHGNMDIKARIMAQAKETVNFYQACFADAERNEDWDMAVEMIEASREAVDDLRDPYAGNLTVATDGFEKRVDAQLSLRRAQKMDKVVKIQGQ